MLDSQLRRLTDPPLALLGRGLVRLGISANAVTIAGFVAGIGALPDLAMGHYLVALIFILLSFLFDGLDGAVARLTQRTELGAYLDAALGFIVCASIPFGFALADASRALAAAFLILGFVASSSSMSTIAVARLGEERRDDSRSTPQAAGIYLERAVLLVAFSLACIFPDRFSIIAYGLGILGFAVAGVRIAAIAAPRRT